MFAGWKKILFLFFLFSFFLTLSVHLWGVSLSPDLVDKLRKEGKLEEWINRSKLARQQGVDHPNPYPPMLGKGPALVDTLKPLVICIDFDDNQHSHDTSEFSSLLFSQGFVYPTGSMRDFYLENSFGQMELMGGVAGWHRLPELYSYYVAGQNGFGPYPNNAQRMAEDAVEAADPYVNFADYDYDQDGWVDALVIVHAGPGAEQTGNPNHIWSHAWSMSTVLVRDGVSLRSYNTDPEVRSGGVLVDMGVFGHEFGHTLGLPDLYDGDYSSEGMGNWTMMAGGSWNNGGKTPACFDGWCKYKMGWTSLTWISSNQTNVEILQAETTPISYRLWASGGGGQQYFMVENRQRTGFDRYIPGDGLLIYHVDEGSHSNSQEWCPGDSASPHFRVALEQADGKYELEHCYGSGNSGEAGDAYPGTWNKRAFDDTTSPSSHDYSDNSTQVAVWNVSDSDSVMQANLDVTWSHPCLFLNNVTFNDSAPGGNGNGRPESGESVKIYFTISNIWLPLNGTTVTGSADTAGITFNAASSFLGDIGTGGSANNHSNPIEFTVDHNFPGKPVTFTLQVEGNGGTYSYDFALRVAVGKAEILIADDDSGSIQDYLSYYTVPLDSLKNIYDVWDTQTKKEPDFSFNQYKYLIWYTGDHKTSLFSSTQVESLISFLDHGGCLFLTSQDAAEVLANSSDPGDTLFLRNYLHSGYGGYSPRHFVMGYAGDEVGDTLWIFPEGTPGANNQSSKDNLIPDSLADTVLVYADNMFGPTDSVAGIKFQGDYKLVYFGFGFEGINEGGYYFHGQWLSQPKLVMERVLSWLKTPWLYLPGDPNGDKIVDVGDVVYLINYLFKNGPAPNPKAAGDVIGTDCVIDVGDVIYLINYLFKSGAPPHEGCAKVDNY